MYIAGAITGVENYKDLFAEAEQVLKRAGYETFNPTCLPPGMEYESYLRIGKQIMVRLGWINYVWIEQALQYRLHEGYEVYSG